VIEAGIKMTNLRQKVQECMKAKAGNAAAYDAARQAGKDKGKIGLRY